MTWSLNRLRQPALRRIIIAVVLAVGGIPALVEADEGLIVRCDLLGCIDRAIAKHPALQTSKARQAAARALIGMRKTQYLPSLRVDGGLGFLSGEPTTPFAEISGISEPEGLPARDLAASGGFYEAGATLKIPIYEHGVVFGQSAGDVGEAAYQLSEEEWRNRALGADVAMSVADAYYGMLKQKKTIESFLQITALLDTVTAQTNANFLQGIASKQDVLIAEVRLAERKKELLTARHHHKRLANALSALIGISRGATLEIQDAGDAHAPLPSYEKLVARVRKHHPDVKAGEFKVLSRVENAMAARGEKYPALSLFGNYRMVDDLDLNVSSLWTTQVRVEWNVFDWWLLRKKEALARAHVVEEQNRLLETKFAVEENVEALYYQIQAQDAEIEFLTKRLALTTDTIRINRARYQQGSLSDAEIAADEIALLEHQFALSITGYDRQLTEFKLRLVSGDLTSLKRPTASVSP